VLLSILWEYCFPKLVNKPVLWFSTPIVAQMDELFAVDAEARRKTLLAAHKRDRRLRRFSRSFSVGERCRGLRLSVRDYLVAFLPALADVKIQRPPELTPNALSLRDALQSPRELFETFCAV
jgi:hypothetical protein